MANSFQTGGSSINTTPAKPAEQQEVAKTSNDGAKTDTKNEAKSNAAAPKKAAGNNN